MGKTRYWTAQAIIDQTAIEVGLDAPGSGIYTSTDKNAVLLRSLLNTAGQWVALQHRFPALIREHTITVANPGDTGEYVLPAGFSGFVEDAAWNRTSDTRIVPISPQTWQYIKTGAVTSTLYVYVRNDQDLLRVETLPANGTVLAFEYWTRYWARATASPLPDKATCTIATDVVHLEPSMMVALLKLRFRQVREFDTTAALLEFEQAFDAAVSRTVMAQTVTLGKGSVLDHRFIDQANLPENGTWGT